MSEKCIYNTWDNPQAIKGEVYRLFARGWTEVALGTDGGPGHVYRNRPVRVFEIRDGRVSVTAEAVGPEKIWQTPAGRPVREDDFEISYGHPWLSWC